MKSVNKYVLFIIMLCVLLSLCAALTSCGQQTINVQLYDEENLCKVAEVENDKEYFFGTVSKTGYTFLGWYSSQLSGSIALTDANGSSAGMTWKTSNPTVGFARWEANKYKLFLDYCGATAFNTVTDISVTYDAEIVEKLPVPERKGHSFLGWFTEKTGGKQITDHTGAYLENASVYNNSVYPLVNEGTTLYAHWGEKTVTYMFVTEDGTSVSERTYQVGTVLDELPTLTKDNYCFVSWCFDSTLISEVTFPFTVPENSEEFVTLYANFVPATIDILEFNVISSTGDREYEVSYRGDGERIVIPDSYYGKKITRIRRIESSTVKEIVIPQTVKEFINGAFQGCSSLEKINIPRAIEAIPQKCFYGCGSLVEFDIPNNVTLIGKEAFAGCSSMVEIHLSRNVTTIHTGAFRNTSSLVSFSIDEENARFMVKDGVLYYGVGASSYLVQYPAAKIGETYEIDESTVKIMEYAFSNSRISSISIGGKITTIETGAFENCENLVNVSISGSAATFSIDSDAFLNCSNLKAMRIMLDKAPNLDATAFEGVYDGFTVYVPSAMIKIYQNATNWRNISGHINSLGMIFGDYALEEVEGGYAIRQYFGTAKEVVIPDIINAKRIVEISENAFSFSAIEKITVSKYVTSIGNGSFMNCVNLRSIIMECEPPTLGDGVFENIYEDFGIYINGTTALLDAYRAAYGWRDLSSYIWSYQ